MVVTFSVPNCLGGMPSSAEPFLLRMPYQVGDSVEYDLRQVTWMRPYGVALLLGACQRCAITLGMPVRLTNLSEDVMRYLRRVNFFRLASSWVIAANTSELGDDWRRSALSDSVLELLPITTKADIFAIIAHARSILQAWFNADTDDIDYIISLITEACSNVIDHSGESGFITIQKYQKATCIAIELVIADFGCGVATSLRRAHGAIAASNVGYLIAALQGRSSRQGMRGGQGLGAIQRIAIQSGGELYLRSGSASVLARASELDPRDALTRFPGTQIAITFISALPWR